MTLIDSCILLLLTWTSSIQFAWLSPWLIWRRRQVHWQKLCQEKRTIPAGLPLIRPIRGNKPDLERALRSSESLLQHDGCHLICVLDAQDEAMDLCANIVADLRAKGLQASICPTQHLPPGNHKANQLTAALTWLTAQQIHYPVHLYCDGDVDCSTIPLHAMYGALLAEPKRAAVWLPFRSHTTEPLAPSIGILEESLQSFTYLGYLSRATCVGKILLLRKQALQEIGGWQSCNHSVGEDMLLGRYLINKGYQIWMGPGFAYCWRTGENEQVFLQRLRRWLLALREQGIFMLLAYPLLLATWPILLGMHCLAAGLALCYSEPNWLGPLMLSATVLSLIRYQLGRWISRQLASQQRSMALKLQLQWRADWQLLQTAWWACWHRRIEWAGQEVEIETEPEDGTKRSS